MPYDILELRDMNDAFSDVNLKYMLDFAIGNPIWVIGKGAGHIFLKLFPSQISELCSAKFVKAYTNGHGYLITTLHDNDICLLTDTEYDVFHSVFVVPREKTRDCSVACSLSGLFL